jgi:hypothetical protein
MNVKLCCYSSLHKVIPRGITVDSHILSTREFFLSAQVGLFRRKSDECGILFFLPKYFHPIFFQIQNHQSTTFAPKKRSLPSDARRPSLCSFSVKRISLVTFTLHISEEIPRCYYKELLGDSRQFLLQQQSSLVRFFIMCFFFLLPVFSFQAVVQ